MADKASLLIEAFPDISTSEWLLALAVREQITTNGIMPTQHGKSGRDYPEDNRKLICTHCGGRKGSTIRGLKTHHSREHKELGHRFSTKTCMEIDK